MTIKESDPQDRQQQPIDPSEIHDEDFQSVLRQLLAAYQPVLELELARAKEPERLKKEAEGKTPNCEDEIALANQIFEKFWTPEIALRLLPKEGRELLGPIERWRWCLLHLRCCIIFGWLVCRGQRTFRSFAYYLYRYWLCVRQVLGNPPIGRPLTMQEREDLQTLIKALAAAYKPYLTDQLATVEFPSGIPDEVVEGKIDCHEGEDEAAAVFERLLTPETAPALLGREFFDAHIKEPSFWFCRCWCLCAIRFGCCLARARNLIDVLRCLVYFRRCLRQCFRPLTCKIIKPAMNDCAREQYFAGPGVLGVEIIGTATGAFCDHYTLEWKAAGAPDSAYSGVGIVYPSGPGPGACGVVNGILGYLNTAVGPIPDDVTVRLCVFGAPGTQPCCDTVTFQIFRQRVWITGIEGVIADPGVLDPLAQLRTAGVVRSFGTALQITGRAWVGTCAGREVKRYALAYQAGFVVDPLAGPWTQFWQLDYLTALQRKEIQTNEFSLTSYWYYQPICLPSPPFPPGTCFPKDWLAATRWQSGRNFPTVPVAPQSFAVDPQVPAVIWTAQQLPLLSNCQSGRYTLRLEVEDTVGDHYYDLQQVWFDNKEIHGQIAQVAGVPPCASINLSQFAPPGANCLVPWPADLLGIAYDEYIEEGNAAVPSDNFGGFSLWIKKDGAPDPGLPIPIPGPGAPPWGPPFVGTSRVGNPSSRCATADPPVVGPVPLPPGIFGMLASLDMRRLDATCNPAEPGLTLQRGGECCGYVIRLLVWDNSICPSLTGVHHSIEHHFPICICNDLPRVG
jgi:hypothetical protein